MSFLIILRHISVQILIAMKVGPKYITLLFIMIMIMSFSSCKNSTQPAVEVKDDFQYLVEQFDDIRVLRYRLPDFEKLTPRQKAYAYYLSQAALAGRDILWDQNFGYNLKIRKTIEAIILSYSGDKDSDEYKNFLIYAKKVFFANGIHHHYSSDKFKPAFSSEYFATLVENSDNRKLPFGKGRDHQALD